MKSRNCLADKVIGLPSNSPYIQATATDQATPFIQHLRHSLYADTSAEALHSSLH